MARQHPEATTEAWAMDEGRIGLKPITRRIWAPRGCRPVARQRRKFQWEYVYAFVHPEDGEVYWLIMPTVSVELFSLALASFAEDIGAGPDRHILLVLDRAGWHASKDLVVPEGIHLFFLPPYSPQLMPAERLWPLLHEAVANRDFGKLDELEDALVNRCREVSREPAKVRALTRYHWWPEERSIHGKESIVQ
jgi:transposase